MANDQVDWNAKQEFYQHLRNEVWDKISVSWEQLAEAENPKQKLDELEKIFIKLKSWYAFVRFYLEPEEQEIVQQLFDDINTITKDKEFSTAMHVETHQWTIIRNSLESVFGHLAYAAAKYGILPTKRDMTGDDVFL
jgi:hypothetical protein